MCDKNTQPELTDYDITMNSLHQDNMFKGTIVVCIIYAVFAFILISAAYFIDNIRNLLFDKFLPFTLIYIVGTIIIIMIFIYNILTFTPKKIDKRKVDENISCPDYWKLEILEDDAINNSFDVDNYSKNLFKYRCVMDDNVFNKLSIFKQDKQAKPENKYKIGNLPGFINDNSVDYIYNDIYKSENVYFPNFYTNNDAKNDKYIYLYKDINKYTDSNLNYINDDGINKNIISDLRESALVMNNYKTKLDSNVSKIISYTDLTSNLDVGNSYRKHYYNSPNIITWSTTQSTTTNEPVSIPTTSLPASTTTLKNYKAIVYDWSDMTIESLTNKYGNKNESYVYIIDISITSSTNCLLVGKLIFDTNEKLYFKSVEEIYIPPTNKVYKSQIDNYNYNFDTTYVASTTLSGNISSINTYLRGPKVRLYNNSRRPPKFENPKAIPDALDFKTDIIPLTCSTVYPSFLAAKEENYTENNTLRCAYSKICNIPWSDMHCNEIADKP